MTEQKTPPTQQTGVQQGSISEAEYVAAQATVAQASREQNFQTEEFTPPAQTPTNPLMEKIRIPGQTYQLPSQGIFYTNGELAPDVSNGEVHVYPMTTIDEIIIRTPDKLFSGDAVRDVFRRCIPSILKPTELFSKDVDFLMVCLRQVSYGENFDVIHTHDCVDATPQEYVVKMNQFIRSTKQIDPTTISKRFETTLDNGQHIKLHPIRYKDVLSLMQVFEEEITPELQQSRMTDTLTSLVADVDGTVDKKHIHEWLSNIPIKWAKQLSKAIDDTTKWGPDFTVKTKCKDCGKQTKITVPMNPVSFFI